MTGLTDPQRLALRLVLDWGRARVTLMGRTGYHDSMGPVVSKPVADRLVGLGLLEREYPAVVRLTEQGRVEGERLRTVANGG